MKDSAQTLVRDTATNVYQPYPASILEVKEETGDIKTFTLKFKDKEIQEGFTFRPGQFVLASLFNCGEAAFSICSSPTFSDYLQLSIKKVGLLTGEIHRYAEGDEIGLRGPYGNGFPLKLLYGSNVLFVGGGIGLAPLRSLIQYLLSKRSEFGQITIFHGARTPGDIVFEKDLATWERQEDVNVETTVYRKQFSVYTTHHRCALLICTNIYYIRTLCLYRRRLRYWRQSRYYTGCGDTCNRCPQSRLN